jgi:hypothetical protein
MSSAARSGTSVYFMNPRTWNEQVDWVYYANGTAQAPGQADARAAAYRSAHTTLIDTVPGG